MRNPIRRLIVAASFTVAATAATSTLAMEDLTGAHALSMFDDVKYGPEFEHFDYADPNAPRGASSGSPRSGPSTTSTPSSSRGTPPRARG